MTSKPFIFKMISLLVILVMVMANFNIAQAQDGKPETPTDTPQAEVKDTPSPTAPVETVETPAATETSPADIETSPTATETPLSPAETATQAPPEPTADVPSTPAAGALPTSFSISGTVTDKDGLGLPGVEIADDQGHHVQTDESGRYSIDRLVPGKYQVRAKLAGLELIPYFRVVPVVDKTMTSVNFYPRHQGAQPDYINIQPLPVNHKPTIIDIPYPGEGEIESQAVTKMGQPGAAYALDPSFKIGTTGVPYAADAVGIGTFNAPTALAIDPGSHLWEAEEHGNRLEAINYDALSFYMEIGDKPGVSFMGDYTYNSLMAVAYQPGTNYLWVGDSTRLVKYDFSLAYPNQFKLQFPATNPWQSGRDNGHFSEIRGIAFNDTGTVMYVSDRFNHRIQIFDVSGTDPVNTGTLGVSGMPGSDGLHFNQPWHMTFFGGYLFVADSQNHRIQKCPTNGSPCTTVAGTGSAGFELDQLNTPTAVAVTSSHLYITDSYNQRIIRCNFDNMIDNITSDCQVFAGVTGEAGSDPDHLSWPADVVVLASHMLYVADRDNHRILVFDDIGSLPPLLPRQFGMTGIPYIRDDTHVNQPWGIAIDPLDNNYLYVAENWGYGLAKYSTSGDHPGELIWRRPEGDATYGSDLHHFGNFSGSNQGNIAIDSLHRIFVPDTGNNRVMIYKPDGTIFGQIGTGQRGSGPYQFSCPNGVAFGHGYLFVADTCNQRIQFFDWNFNYMGTIGKTGIAGADSNHFSNPVALAGDPVGNNIYVVDQGNQRVQRCHADGPSTNFTCAPFAGVTGVSGGRDFHYLNHPVSAAFDVGSRRVLISEADTSRIQVFNGDDGAYLTTISGELGDEAGRVRLPAGISIDSNGTAYVADRENARVLRFSFGAYPWTQVNLNGVGNPFNTDITGLTYVKVHYNGVLTMMLYVLASNSLPSKNLSQVWRRLPDFTWQAVSAPGFSSTTTFGLTDMAYYQNSSLVGSLYVGTYNSNGAQLWRCKDLATNPCEKPSDWNLVPAPVGASVNNKIVSRMVVFNNLLFVSYLNWSGSGPYTSDGGEVWAYDGINWTSGEPLLKLSGTTTGTGHTINGIHSMAVSNDGTQLYAGTADYINLPSTPAQLYRYAYDAQTTRWNWERVLENGINDTDNTGISSLLDNNGYLYLGTYNSTDGAMIYRYSDINLGGGTIVVSGGLHSTQNVAISAMKASGSQIYALTSNNHSGVQVLTAPIITGGLDGTWDDLSIKFGFGNATNSSITSDSSLAFSTDGNLMAGTWNDDNGGSLWLYTPDRPYLIGGHINYHGTELTKIRVTLQPNGWTTFPDSSGDYNFNNLLPGAYTITAQYSYLSFSPPIQRVTIKTDSVDGVNFSVASGGVNLRQPPNGTQLTSLDPLTLQWDKLLGTTSYTLQVSNSPGFSPLLKNITQAGTTFKLAGLLANKTYYWKVRKANSPAGAWSVTFSFKTPVLGPPAAPVLQAPLNGAALPAGTQKPTRFSWKPSTIPTGSTPVQHYHIQVSRQNTFIPLDIDENTPGPSTTFIPTANLTPNQVYYWRVRAFNSAGDTSAWSSPFSFKVKPVPPLSARIYDANTIQPGIHWTDPYCTGKYFLQVYKVTSILKQVISVTVTTGAGCEGDYKLTTSLLINTRYEWYITTQGVTGSSLPLTMPFSTPFSVPGAPTLAGPANNAIIPAGIYPDWKSTLSWNQVSTVAPIIQLYHVQVATQPGFGVYTFIDTSVDAPDTSITVGPLKYNTSVYWRVRACNNLKICSVWSAVRKLVTRPATPDPTTNEYNSLQVLFRWHDPGGNFAKSYNLVIYSNAACTTLYKSVTVTTTSYSTAVSANRPYCWKVRGIGASSTITGTYSPFTHFGPLTVLPAPSLSTPNTGALISSSGLVPSEYRDYPVTFLWGGTVGASYNIQISRNSTFTDLRVDNTSLVDPKFNFTFSGGKYYWRVRAGTGGLWGPWSVARNFSTKPQLLGRVRSETGASMSSVVIAVTGVAGTIPVNSSGYFAADNLPTGTHTLTFTRTGYLTQTRSMSFANGMQYEANATMIPVPDSGLLRIILTWNPAANRKLGGHLWLPTGSSAMHIFDPNVGKDDLDAFPYAMAHPETAFLGTTYFDIKPGLGKYVFAVNQEVPATTSWSGSTAKVEVYSGPTLKKSCPLPSGSGRWWYAFDLSVTGTTQTVTCKASLRPTSPAPYPDHPISGRVIVADTHHPLQGAVIRYAYGKVKTDPYGYFIINGIISGGTTLFHEINPAYYTVDHDSFPALIDTSSNNFIATPTSSMLGVPAPSAITLQGDYAYLGVGRWLYILNIKNKTAPPVFLSRLWLGGGMETERITQIVISGHFAFVVANPHMDVIEITDPLHPYYAGMVAFNNAVLRRAAVSGEIAYLADNNFFYIYNWASGPVAASNPVWAYAMAMGGPGGAMDVTLQGKYAFVVGTKGLYIFDVTNPYAPVGPWLFPTPEGLSEVEVDGAYAYVQGNNKLYILDISDPAHVIQVSELDYTANPMNMSKSGDFLYLPLYRIDSSTPYGMTIIDVSNPKDPHVEGNYHDTSLDQLGGFDVDVQENYAFLAQSDASLSIGRFSLIDVAGKDAPVEVTSYTPEP